MSRRIRVKGHRFSDAPAMYMRRTKFDRSHVYKTTFDSGKLIPVFVDEVLPGDTSSLRVRYFSRLATPVKPIMDNIYLDWFFFFVPNRLVWNHWQNFCFEQEDPDDSIDYVCPTISLIGKENDTLNGVGTLWDYFGLPTGLPKTISGINALPFRGVYLIWNEWFRDENLQKSVKIQKGDTNEVFDGSRVSEQPEWLSEIPESYLPCPPRGKRHDYFTSALPWTQKGPGVQISLSGNAPVFGTGSSLVFNYSGGRAGVICDTTSGGNAPLKLNALASDSSVGSSVPSSNVPINAQVVGLAQSGDTGAYADLSDLSAISINSLRTAFQMQKFYERLARGGSRYTEVLRSFFGVVSPDARLQRPEFLGSFTKMMNINPIAQTSSTNDTTPQGNLSAYGVTGAKFHGFTKSFVEHGYVFGFCCARADLTYQQGINRMWTRSTVYDWYWPTFAHLGEQAVLLKEIYATGDVEQDDSVFGYQERYAEYRYKPSVICGKFRSNIKGNLDVWHLSQYFESPPKLNPEFIEEDVPIGRIIAVSSEPQFLIDIGFKYTTVRPMPMFGTPGLVDHF
jgi:hypothetical protein